MNEISPYANEEDEQLGLDVYNAVWPHDRLGLEEERSYRASLRDHVDLLARSTATSGAPRSERSSRSGPSSSSRS